MKLTGVLDKIKSAVASTERITGKNLNLPVLDAILFVAEKDSLKLRSTNLTIGIEVEVPANVASEGIIAVPGAVAANIFANLSGDTKVTLGLKNDNLTIANEHTSMTVKTIPHEDFPTLPHVSEEHSFKIPADKLVEGIKSVSYAASVLEIKPEIASVYLYGDQDELVFVATDSFRLAEKKIKVNKLPKIEGLMIPVKNAHEIARVIGDIDEEVTVSFTENQISFKAGHVYITSRLVAGSYPDYRQIMPGEFISEAVILKQDLANALRVTNIFSDKFQQVGITANPKKKTCKFSSKNADVGESETEVNATLFGEEFKTIVNQRYLTDSFQSIPQFSITLQFADVNKALTVRGVSDTSFTYLVMPMNR